MGWVNSITIPCLNHGGCKVIHKLFNSRDKMKVKMIVICWFFHGHQFCDSHVLHLISFFCCKLTSFELHLFATHFKLVLSWLLFGNKMIKIIVVCIPFHEISKWNFSWNHESKWALN